MMEALEKLPPGSTIYVGVNYRQSFEPQLRLPWSHFAAYAAIRRGMFVADVWADPTQNWIVQTPHYKTLADLRPLNNRVDNSPRPAPGHDMYDPALVSGFDYLLAVQPELYQGPAAKQAHVIAQSGNGVLFSLHR